MMKIQAKLLMGLLVLSQWMHYSCNQEMEPVKLVSPGSNIHATIWKDSTGYHFNASTRDSFAFIVQGDLGLRLEANDSLFTALKSIDGPFAKREVVRAMGITDSAVVSWNEYILTFDSGEKMEFRVFDDGVAYRYIVDNGLRENRVMGERSSWTIPENPKVWFFERNNHWKLKSYAGEWISTEMSRLPGVSETGNIQGKPLIFEYHNGQCGILTEAGLFHYSGMRFEAFPGNTLRANFTEGAEGFQVDSMVVSPWRVALIADDLNQLVNQQSTIISLNPKPDANLFSDRSWIKPGKSVWRWWSNQTGTPEQEKKMVDYAKALEFEYNLIDDAWEGWPNKWRELAAICRYGKANNVGIWVWKDSHEFNFPEGDYRIMQSFMDSLRNAGVVGVKVDFINGENKSLIDFDEAVLRHAAKRKLMVNFHGVQTSTGEIKTYPNELTREGIRGLELNTHPEGPITPVHNAALPFTRFVLGQGDYTPLGFTATGGTTWAHQLATLVLFTSPVQVIAENPEILLQHPAVKDALPLIKKVPSVWDETVVLPGSQIGELAAMARRKGDTWYIGVLNGGEKKKVKLDLSVLDIPIDEFVLYHDAPKNITNPIARGVNARDSHYSEVITPFLVDTVRIADGRITLTLEKHGGAVLVGGS